MPLKDRISEEMKAAMKEGGKEMPPEVMELIRTVKAHGKVVPHPVPPIPGGPADSLETSLSQARPLAGRRLRDRRRLPAGAAQRFR